MDDPNNHYDSDIEDSNLNIACLMRIFKLGFLTILVNICSNMTTLSFFLLHVQRFIGNEKDFHKSYLTNFKKK